ncbi:hypothetical protein [Sorangium sp. So ce406]
MRDASAARGRAFIDRAAPGRASSTARPWGRAVIAHSQDVLFLRERL